MSHAQLMEREFEDNLCAELAERGWLYEDDGKPSGWDIALAMVPVDVLHWLSTQYPDEYEKAVPGDLVGDQRADAERKLLQHITRELAKTTKMDPTTGHPSAGCSACCARASPTRRSAGPPRSSAPMMEFPPANPNLTEVVEAADSVRLRVLRQVRFDTTTNETHRRRAHGQRPPGRHARAEDRQHTDGQPRDPAVQGGPPAREEPAAARAWPSAGPLRGVQRPRLHDDEAPGRGHRLPAFQPGQRRPRGQPTVEHRLVDELPVARDPRATDLHAHPQGLRAVRAGQVRASKDDGRLVFPRFHQLRAVERVVADIEANGTGKRYLIWHSAGSGKTKTIAWLSHRLIRHMSADSKSTFDSVIVVTDRTVLDENIRDDMNLVQSSKGLVVAVGEKSGAKSPQLRKALLEGDHIITCTLQTFPEVMKLIEDTEELRGRRWAVVADEAHSSQSGSAARAAQGAARGSRRRP